MSRIHAQQTFVMRRSGTTKTLCDGWRILLGKLHIRRRHVQVRLYLFIIIVRSSSCISAGDVNMVPCVRVLTFRRHVPISATEQWTHLPRLWSQRATIPSSKSFHLSEKAGRRPAATAPRQVHSSALVGGVENGRR